MTIKIKMGMKTMMTKTATMMMMMVMTTIQPGQRHVCKTDDASLGLEASGDGPVGPLLQRSFAQRHICMLTILTVSATSTTQSLCSRSGAPAQNPAPPEPAQCRSHVAAKSQRRTVSCATASSMCASIASLASKNPGLWKSSRTLARCGEFSCQRTAPPPSQLLPV